MKMNRVIKFRAWDKEENKMINNVVPFFNSDGKLECLVFGYSFGGYDFIEVELDKYQHIFTVSELEKRYVLMQYTGLKDKNGVYIYEGDVLRDSESIVIVKFVDGEFSVDYRTMGGKWRNYGSLFDYLKDYEGEVIGNIHENPELLEVES